MTARLDVALCDLGLGNLRSVETALEAAALRRGLATKLSITREPSDVLRADRVIVPGQGAFRDGSRALEGAMGDALRSAIARGTPYFGICLGLQLLFESSEEADGARGLGVLRGAVKRLAAGEGATAVKIPHMGWNEIELRENAPRALRAANDVSRWMYFVHSFHAAPDDRSLVCATSQHGANVVAAAIARGPILATQFHPEKSQTAGIELLGAFLEGDVG